MYWMQKGAFGLGSGRRPKIEKIIQDTLCNHCYWAKDRVNNVHVNGCYCVHYGFIVSKLKQRCQGYRPEGERVKRHDGNDTETDSGST